MSRNDVVIVGAGITGASLALGLALVAKQRIVLVDHEAPAAYSEGPGNRVSALGLAAERVLTRIGVWQELPADRVSPYRHMQIWDAGSSGQLDFDAAEIGESHLGHIIENDLLVHHLHLRIRDTDLVSSRLGETPVAISYRHDAIGLRLESGEEIEASLLVGADGGQSWVRTQLDISTRTHEYHQLGIVCRIATGSAHRETAWQRFLPTGPVAVLPLADGASSIVWSADEERARELLDMDAEEFVVQLRDALEGRLGNITLLGSRQAFPLKSTRVDHYIAERVALVGDAAHRVHPLAGQGANLGLKDVATLVDVVEAAAAVSRDIGVRQVLRRYERWRKTENSATDLLMSALNIAFDGRRGVPGLIRGPGMNMLNRASGIKALMARYAMGVAGDLPKMIEERP
jgi:2-octaprenylphenol hydroxylase